MDFNVDHQLDTTGLCCPEPVMMLHNKVRDMGVDEVLEVIATDPSTQRDIPKFCNFLDHELLKNEVRDSKYFYYIRKAVS